MCILNQDGTTTCGPANQPNPFDSGTGGYAGAEGLKPPVQKKEQAQEKLVKDLSFTDDKNKRWYTAGAEGEKSYYLGSDEEPNLMRHFDAKDKATGYYYDKTSQRLIKGDELSIDPKSNNTISPIGADKIFSTKHDKSTGWIVSEQKYNNGSLEPTGLDYGYAKNSDGKFGYHYQIKDPSTYESDNEQFNQSFMRQGWNGNNQPITFTENPFSPNSQTLGTVQQGTSLASILQQLLKPSGGADQVKRSPPPQSTGKSSSSDIIVFTSARCGPCNSMKARIKQLPPGVPRPTIVDASKQASYGVSITEVPTCFRRQGTRMSRLNCPF